MIHDDLAAAVGSGKTGGRRGKAAQDGILAVGNHGDARAGVQFQRRGQELIELAEGLRLGSRNKNCSACVQGFLPLRTCCPDFLRGQGSGVHDQKARRAGRGDLDARIGKVGPHQPACSIHESHVPKRGRHLDKRRTGFDDGFGIRSRTAGGVGRFLRMERWPRIIERQGGIVARIQLHGVRPQTLGLDAEFAFAVGAEPDPVIFRWRAGGVRLANRQRLQSIPRDIVNRGHEPIERLLNIDQHVVDHPPHALHFGVKGIINPVAHRGLVAVGHQKVLIRGFGDSPRHAFFPNIFVIPSVALQIAVMGDGHWRLESVHRPNLPLSIGRDPWAGGINGLHVLDDWFPAAGSIGLDIHGNLLGLQGCEKLVFDTPTDDARVVAVPENHPRAFLMKALPCFILVDRVIRPDATLSQDHHPDLVRHFIKNPGPDLHRCPGQIDMHVAQALEVSEHLAPAHVGDPHEVDGFTAQTCRTAIDGELVAVKSVLPPAEADGFAIHGFSVALQIHQRDIEVRALRPPKFECALDRRLGFECFLADDNTHGRTATQDRLRVDFPGLFRAGEQVRIGRGGHPAMDRPFHFGAGGLRPHDPGLDHEFVLIHKRLNKDIGNMGFRQGDERDILPDAGALPAPERVAGERAVTANSLMVKQRIAAHPDQDFVFLIQTNNIGHIHIKRKVEIEVPLEEFPVHPHLALPGDRFKMDAYVPARPFLRHHKLSAHPGHLHFFPCFWITWKIPVIGTVWDQAGIFLKRVHVPWRGDFDRNSIPGRGRRVGQRRRFSHIPHKVGRDRHGLKIPAPVQADLLAERLLGFLHPAARRRGKRTVEADLFRAGRAKWNYGQNGGKDEVSFNGRVAHVGMEWIVFEALEHEIRHSSGVYLLQYDSKRMIPEYPTRASDQIYKNSHILYRSLHHPAHANSGHSSPRMGSFPEAPPLVAHRLAVLDVAVQHQRIDIGAVGRCRARASTQ